MGCLKILHSDQKSALSKNWKIFVGGVEKSVSSEKNRINYYPFGMLQNERSFSSPAYRYGFQGQEKDDEVKGNGNSVNYKYRMHDPRIGRFFAIDPLAARYPYNSVYAFSENSVIQFIELEGLEKVEKPITLPDPSIGVIDWDVINAKIEARSFMNHGTHIDTGDFGKSATTTRNGVTYASTYTAAGGVRNHVAYWNKLVETKPEMFSEGNLARISNGSAPEVDDIWVKNGNANHSKYTGDKLIHHHSNQGRSAYAIPQKVHHKMSRYLHPISSVKGATKTIRSHKINAKLGQFGTVFNVAGFFTDFVSDNPGTMWNMTFGWGVNVGQLYKARVNGESHGCVTCTQYIMITKRVFHYNDQGDYTGATVTYDSFDSLYDADTKELGIVKTKSGQTSEFDADGNKKGDLY